MKVPHRAFAKKPTTSRRPKFRLRSAWVLIAVLLLDGCAAPSVRIDPSVLHSNYDYVKPAEIADKSKPVWVLPVINKGWVPAAVDPRTGDWISGHYTASIIQEGHWATLEEAELAGKPYVVSGESKPVVPLPSEERAAMRDVPSSAVVGGEIDLAELTQRVGKLEQKSAESSGAPETEQTEEASEQIRVLAQNAGTDSQAIVPPLARSQSYHSSITAEVHDASEVGAGHGSSKSAVTVELPGSVVATDSEVPVLGGLSVSSERARVRYLEGNRVRISYQGRDYEVELDRPGDSLALPLAR